MIFFDETGSKVFLVKPSYKEHWLFPGGVVEADESPKAGAIREVKEEIGIDVNPSSLLVVDYVPASSVNGVMVHDALIFLFYGGRMSEEMKSRIVLDNEEIVDSCFFTLEEAASLLNVNSRRRLEYVIEAIEKGITVYIEKECKA